MTPNRAERPERSPLVLDDDERAIVELYRALGLDGSEALRRLATPSPSPVLPGCQELLANLSAVARDPFNVEARPAPPRSPDEAGAGPGISRARMRAGELHSCKTSAGVK